MSNQTSPANPESNWIYMVFNWGSPIGCFTSVSLALVCCAVVSRNWGNPIPEGALSVKRFVPALGLCPCQEEDLTDLVMRQLKTFNKVCDD